VTKVETQQKIANMLNTAGEKHGIFRRRQEKTVGAKIKHMEEKFRETLKYMENTGQGIKNEQNLSDDKFKDLINERWKHFWDLFDIMKERSSMQKLVAADYLSTESDENNNDDKDDGSGTGGGEDSSTTSTSSLPAPAPPDSAVDDGGGADDDSYSIILETTAAGAVVDAPAAAAVPAAAAGNNDSSTSDDSLSGVGGGLVRKRVGSNASSDDDDDEGLAGLQGRSGEDSQVRGSFSSPVRDVLIVRNSLVAAPPRSNSHTTTPAHSTTGAFAGRDRTDSSSKRKSKRPSSSNISVASSRGGGAGGAVKKKMVAPNSGEIVMSFFDSFKDDDDRTKSVAMKHKQNELQETVRHHRLMESIEQKKAAVEEQKAVHSYRLAAQVEVDYNWKLREQYKEVKEEYNNDLEEIARIFPQLIWFFKKAELTEEQKYRFANLYNEWNKERGLPNRVDFMK
jgi:hypothetical protein